MEDEEPEMSWTEEIWDKITNEKDRKPLEAELEELICEKGEKHENMR